MFQTANTLVLGLLLLNPHLSFPSPLLPLLSNPFFRSMFVAEDVFVTVESRYELDLCKYTSRMIFEHMNIRDG